MGATEKKKTFKACPNSTDGFRGNGEQRDGGTVLTRKGNQAKFQTFGTAGRSTVPEEGLGAEGAGGRRASEDSASFSFIFLCLEFYF